MARSYVQKTLKTLLKKVLELIKKSSKIAEYKSNMQNQLYFYMLSTKYSKEKLRNKSQLQETEKSKILKTIFNQRDERPVH